MIVMLTQCFPPIRGGIENLMHGLAEALARSGAPLTVLADDSAGAGEVTFAYPVRRFGGQKHWRRWRKQCALRGHTPAALIADSWKSLEGLAPQPVPVVMLAHGMEFPEHPSARKAARMHRAIARATVVVANSAYTAARVTPYLQKKQRLEIIHPPIDLQPEAAAPHPLYAGATLRLLSLSRLEPRKGIDQVIRAMPALLARHPHAVYVVAGGGDDLPRLEALAAELGVAAQVQFAGRVDAAEKAALLAHADLFVMPTRREGNSVEGFGISYIEAAWYGIPALAGRDGGAVDAVLDGVTGLLCDGADAADVEATLLRLAGDAALRTQLGEAAKARARSELQWDAAVKRYLALLQR